MSPAGVAANAATSRDLSGSVTRPSEWRATMTTPSVTRRTSWIKTIGRRSRTCSKSLRPLSVSRLSGMRSRRPSFATRSRDSPALPTTWRRPSWFKEQALAAAEARLAELEEQPAEARPANGGFFDSLFGDRREPQRSSGSVPRTGTATREPMQGQHPGGGGFLAGAAQTALGVTGGVLGNAIAGMLWRS